MPTSQLQSTDQRWNKITAESPTKLLKLIVFTTAFTNNPTVFKAAARNELIAKFGDISGSSESLSEEVVERCLAADYWRTAQPGSRYLRKTTAKLFSSIWRHLVVPPSEKSDMTPGGVHICRYRHPTSPCSPAAATGADTDPDRWTYQMLHWLIYCK